MRRAIRWLSFTGPFFVLLACSLAGATAAAEEQNAPPGCVRAADVVDGHIHPSLCLTRRGVLVATYGRVNHRDLRLVRSTDGGRTWSAPQSFSPTVGKTYYPGSLTALANGDVVHAWNRWNADDDEKEPRSVVYSLSRDDGQTWEAVQAFPRKLDVRSVIRHPLVELPDGRWLASLDDRTFLWNPKTQEAESFGDGRLHGLVPIVRTPRGTWVSGAGVRSEDDGRTWAEIPDFPNLREQGWRHELVCLSNGWLLASEILGPGVGGERIRYRISRDDGRTWKAAYEYYNPNRPIGGRACPRTVEIDPDTIGVIFYDVSPAQPGGPGLFFKRIALRDLPK